MTGAYSYQPVIPSVPPTPPLVVEPQTPPQSGVPAGRRRLRWDSNSHTFTFAAPLDVKETSPRGKDEKGGAAESKAEHLLRLGATDESVVRRWFKEMLARVDHTRIVIRSEKIGKVFALPCKSRWNPEDKYAGRLEHRFIDEVKGLRKAVLLTLTVKPDTVKEAVPDWWTLDPRIYMIARGGAYVRDFLKALRKYRKRRGLSWNYIGWVAEFHESGWLHYHLIFAGGWVAPIDVLRDMWGLSERQGIDVKVVPGHAAARYVAKYIGKGFRHFGQPGCPHPELLPWVWWFKTRLYNIRHSSLKGAALTYLTVKGDRFTFLGIGRGGRFTDESTGLVYTWTTGSVECRCGSP